MSEDAGATRRADLAALLQPIWARWWDTAAALRRALPELSRGELALLCAYLGAGFAVRAGIGRETWEAVGRIAFEHVGRVLPELLSDRHRLDEGA